MIEELKPSLLTEKGLAEALKTTAELFSQRSSIPVQSRFELSATLAPEMEMAVYRITQEALANIEKHSAAQKVTLELTYDEDDVILNIKDDGKGFNPGEASPGHGLRNMRLRAEEVEGAVDIVSRPGLGTSLVAKFPRKA